MNVMARELIAGKVVGIQKHGQGVPCLLIHCALAHSGAFIQLMHGLSDIYEMTAFDLPGHGVTQFDETADIHDQSVEIAVEILKRQDQPSHIIGHSFGATVALRLAVEYPELVMGLSLYEPVYFAMLHDVNPAAYKQEEVDSREFIEAAIRDDWPAAARAFLKRWSVEDFDNISAAQQVNILKTIPLIVASTQSIIHPEKAGEILRKLPEIEFQVLLMAGEYSPKVVHHILDAMGTKIPQARRKIISGAAHMGPITHANAVANLIRGAIA